MTDTVELAKGDIISVDVQRPAHGGEGIAHHDGRVIFVQGGIPGDTVDLEITQLKKNWARGHVVAVTTPSADRVDSRCPAAALGAGCCDYAELNPEAEMGIKTRVLTDQLERIGGVDKLPNLELHDLQPSAGWRTRVRLGVDASGRAGFRKLKSTELVTSAACSQVVPQLLDGLVGEGAQRFTPGAEIIAAIDDNGNRHVVESRKAPRGRRTETILKVLEGTGEVVQKVGDYTWTFNVSSFWQAHAKAPSAYSQFIASVLDGVELIDVDKRGPVAWDLYGGVGLFAPVITAKLGAHVHSVELSEGSAESGEAALGELPVTFHTGKVEGISSQLPSPHVVVLDPPRTGAGSDVIESIAQARPQLVIHIGCDPATFARDVADWSKHGFEMDQLAVFNAFPGTHHFETIGVFTRVS
ncbi:putative RNA methyltransferase [Corynebacterium deserti GIMN1.010]|uniref:Putative RNA methyltransferase n=1 Tax=Corynebacterium deserti GIMN1.010 TaxID=931089 RepID=A0A0M3Q9S2_9CORY|nr:TRAM domain-containing protein [Corynebacterium deserti]ALC06093.1 putative RNA methyltransferase [Corynebacterium deserti GIMN1.010]